MLRYYVHMDTVKTTPMALKELLTAADLCLKYPKRDNGWGMDGVLGFPATILLLSFIDSLGFLLTIKGTAKDLGSNSKPGNNFDILMSKKYFSEPMSNTQRDVIYDIFRGYILHQSVLGEETRIERNENTKKILYKYAITDTTDGWALNLHALYNTCCRLYENNKDEIELKAGQEIFVGRLGN